MLLSDELQKHGDFLFKHRGILPLILLIPEYVIYCLNLFEGDKKYFFLHHNYFYICFVISFIGLVIRIFTVGFTPMRTSGRNTGKQIADQLNTSGLYSIVRHPLYLGNFFIWLGVALLIQSVWYTLAFILLFWIFYERIIIAEEKFLQDQFGNYYDQWVRQAPTFIPRFGSWQSPNSPFNYKKVIRNEKNGLLGLFLVYWVFDVSKIYIIDSQIAVNFWTWGLVSGCIVYVFVKISTRNTNFFNKV